MGDAGRLGREEGPSQRRRPTAAVRSTMTRHYSFQKSGDEAIQIEIGKDEINVCAFTSDGTRALTGDQRGLVRLADVQTGAASTPSTAIAARSGRLRADRQLCPSGAMRRVFIEAGHAAWGQILPANAPANLSPPDR